MKELNKKTHLSDPNTVFLTEAWVLELFKWEISGGKKYKKKSSMNTDMGTRPPECGSDPVAYTTTT